MKLIPLKEKPEEIFSLLIDRLKKKFKKDLLFVGGKGSIATGKFTPLSDIDVVVAIKKGKEKYYEFVYGTTYIDIRVAPIKNLVNDLKNINMSWPLRAGGILNLKLYYEKNKSFSVLKKTVKELRKDKFEQAVELNSFIEYYSKSHRAFHNKDYEQLYWTTFELFHQFAFVIALLNKQYYISQGPINFINQIKKFNYKPAGWESAIRLSMSRNPKKAFDGVQKMWKILNTLRKKHNFRSYDIKQLKEVKF